MRKKKPFFTQRELRVKNPIKNYLIKTKQIGKVFDIKGCNEGDPLWKETYESVKPIINNLRMAIEPVDLRPSLFNAAIRIIKAEIIAENEKKVPQMRMFKNSKMKSGGKIEAEKKVTEEPEIKKLKEKGLKDRQMNIITENIETTAEIPNNIPHELDEEKEEPKKQPPIQELLPPFSTFK